MSKALHLPKNEFLETTCRLYMQCFLAHSLGTNSSRDDTGLYCAAMSLPRYQGYNNLRVSHWLINIASGDLEARTLSNISSAT